MTRRNVRDLILLLRDVRIRDVREMLEKCSVCYFVRTEFLLNYWLDTRIQYEHDDIYSTSSHSVLTSQVLARAVRVCPLITSKHANRQLNFPALSRGASSMTSLWTSVARCQACGFCLYCQKNILRWKDFSVYHNIFFMQISFKWKFHVNLTVLAVQYKATLKLMLTVPLTIALYKYIACIPSN